MTSEFNIKRNDPAHILYTSEDKDAPECIKDSNGDIALGLCKICGKGEVDLGEPCATPSAEPLAGLQRYRLHWHDFDTADMETDSEGEYVLHSEAAKIVAAKDKHIEALQEKFTSESCGCSFDKVGDVCLGHSPRVKELEAELADIKSDALKWREHQQSIGDYLEEWSKFTDEQEKFENGK